jgi:NSS family neurotransmitter:Na+ symporter
MDQKSLHGMWSSKLAFILAATGSAVGLGNIWRFPYITSEYGGGAFVLLYLGFIVLLGLPIMFSEIIIGRHGHASPINAIKKFAGETGASRIWSGIGWIGILAGILILSFYSVVAGWTLYYGFDYAKQLVGAADAISDPDGMFGALLGSPGQLMFWHALFMLLTMFVVGMGVEKGLERAVRFLMPTLFVLLLVLLGYALTTGHVGEAASFLFSPDFSKLGWDAVLAAMGQAFFTLSLGMCTIMTYGAYLPDDVSVPKVGVTVAFSDTMVALMAGMAIFPIVLSFGIDPAGGGPGLIFTSLPLAFNEMPLGILYGLMFFVLLSVAAWTSSISLLEPATAYLIEATNLTRKGAALLVAVISWLVGLVTVLGYNVWKNVTVGERDLQGVVEYIAADIMLPLGGLLIALFAGWVIPRHLTEGEFDKTLPSWVYNLWRFLVRFIAPVLIFVVLVATLRNF